MQREISSSTQTNFFQAGFVLVSFPIFLFFIASLAQSEENWFSMISYFLAFLTVLIVTINLIFKLNRVKIVEEKKAFIIQTSSWFSSKRILVPYKNVKKVSQVFLMKNPEVVTIELLISTDLGNKIRFIPKFRFFSFGEHPIVDELNNRIKQYQLSQ